MMVLAIITRPRALRMRQMSIAPRTLAGKLMLIATGESNANCAEDDVLAIFSIAVDATLVISDMGRQAAPCQKRHPCISQRTQSTHRRPEVGWVEEGGCEIGFET